MNLLDANLSGTDFTELAIIGANFSNDWACHDKKILKYMKLSCSVFSILKFTNVISKRGLMCVPDRNSAIYSSKRISFGSQPDNICKDKSWNSAYFEKSSSKGEKERLSRGLHNQDATITTRLLRAIPANSCGQAFFCIRFSSISAPARRNRFDRGQYLATSPATFRLSSTKRSGAWPNTWRRLNKRRARRPIASVWPWRRARWR